jgi:hypothetical protein
MTTDLRVVAHNIVCQAGLPEASEAFIFKMLYADEANESLISAQKLFIDKLEKRIEKLQEIYEDTQFMYVLGDRLKEIRERVEALEEKKAEESKFPF